LKGAAAALALLGALGCGSSQSAPDAGDVINCQGDARVTPYTPNMSVLSASKSMRFILVQSNPAPPAALATHTWNVRVTDSAGALAGLDLSVKPWMPDHGHGPSVVPQVAPAGGGSYTVTNIYLMMAGVWQITFTSAAPADTAVFTFCVPG